MRFVILHLILALQAALPTLSSETPSSTESVFGEKYTNTAPLVPAAYDRNVVTLVGEILQRSHYGARAFNDEISSQFLDRYLDALDPQHLYFLQSDLDEFERYRTRLDNLVLEDGESLPARVIFRRFRQRIDQQYDFVRQLLETEQFKFDLDERYLINRKDEPRPQDLEEARKLWRNRIRYEYLQEKLNIGRPEVIADLIREKLQADQTDQIPEALKGKVSDEKAQALLKLVKENQAENRDVETIIQAVLDKLHRDNHAEIVKVIARRYNRILRSINEYDNDDVLQIFLTSLARVYDPHSDYMGRATLENFSIGMKLSLFGIGALLSSEEGYCKIVSLTPNGPAERSKKLKPNDKIIAVAQGPEEPVDVVDMKLSKVVDLIRGPKGTEVRLTVIPADAPDPSVRKEVALVRDQIKLEDQEAKARIFEIPNGTSDPTRLGLIDLPSFYSSFELAGNEAPSGEDKSTTSDVARLVRKLVKENVAGIILDLRRNGGGSLEEAINLTGLFIKEGPVVQVRDPSGRVIVDKDPDPGILYEGPLIVLTSRFSASASEILAGALQDYDRALIVGDTTTHGKGTVQSLIQLGPILRHQGVPEEVNPGALKITIRKFYRASGASTQLKGIEPDIILPSVNNHADVGEDSLDNAMAWDTIRAADYEEMDLIDPFLEELRRQSQQRVASNADFDFIREEIERYKQKRDEKYLSLNEAKRMQEKEEADARRQARLKELADRPEPPGHVYELTLKDVDQPGLPQPGTQSGEESTAATQNPAQEDTLAAAEEEEETPALDVVVEETKQILLDMIRLSSKSAPVTTVSTQSSP